MRWLELAFAALTVGLAANGLAAQETAPVKLLSASLAPLPKPAADGAYFVGPHVTAPQLVRVMAAGYPYDVPARKIAGQTVLTMIVGVDGKATKLEVVRSHGELFDASAMNAVELSRFAPGLLDGKSVPVRIDVQVPFHESGKQAVPMVAIAERDLAPPAPTPEGKKQPSYTPPVPIHIADADFPNPDGKNPYHAVALVTVLVGTDGSPQEVRVSRGLGFGMDEKAAAAVKKWRFIPATSKGRAVAERRNVEVNFTLF
jgi:TonB family protein